MFIAYFIVLALSILFKVIHWPGVELLLLFSCVLPLIDIFIQSVRLKSGKKLRILSSAGLLGISIFLIFLLLKWPGENMLFFGAIAMTIPYFSVFFNTKARKDLRFYLMIFIILFAAFNFFMKESARKEFYMSEDPFSDDHIPSFILRDLAFDYYMEDKPEKSEFLLNKALRQLEKQKEYIADNKLDPFRERIVSDNFEGISQDLQSVKNRNWERKSNIIYEDFIPE